METKPHYMALNKVKLLKAKHHEFYLLGSFFAFLFYLFKNKKTAQEIFSLFELLDNFLLKYISFLRAVALVTVGTIKKI